MGSESGVWGLILIFEWEWGVVTLIFNEKCSSDKFKGPYIEKV